MLYPSRSVCFTSSGLNAALSLTVNFACRVFRSATIDLALYPRQSREGSPHVGRAAAQVMPGTLMTT